MTVQPPEDIPECDGHVDSPSNSLDAGHSQDTINSGQTARIAETLPTNPVNERSPNSRPDSSKLDATVDFLSGEAVTQDFVPRTATSPDAPHRKSMPSEIGDYQIIKVLGRGGMGVVYKARHKKLGRDVALKMVLAGTHASEDQLLRFTSEAKAVAHLQHPNIVQIFEVGEQDGLPFFSLEYVDGQSLDKQLARKPLPATEAARMTETICRAIQYAHDHGVLHRDLKPANLLLTKDGTPKISDFGLAKRLEDVDDSESTRTGTIMGTPSYMSPEQACGHVRELGPATDQYSLGAMLYEFLTGRPPFLAAKPLDTIFQVIHQEPIAPRKLHSKLPMDLETICLKALQKEPTKRYASCAGMADDLGRFLRGEPILARPVSRAERAWRWCRRNPLVSSLALAAVLSMFAVALISSWSAITLSWKNSELAESNNALNSANDTLKKTNEDLASSNEENVRRSQRLKTYVQETFTELNRINTVENPRMKGFKSDTIAKTLPLLDEIVAELPKTEQAAPTRASMLTSLANSYREQGDVAAAARIYRDLVNFGAERIQIKGNSDAARGNLISWLLLLAQVQLELDRDFDANLALLHRALAMAEDLARNSRASPDDGLGQFPLYRRKSRLAEVQHTLGISYYRLGNSELAKTQFYRAEALREEVIASIDDGSAFQAPPPSFKVPSDKEKQEEKRRLVSVGSRAMLAKASVLYRTGNADQADVIYQQVLAQTRRAYEADSGNPLRRGEYVGFLGMVAEFQSQTGKGRESLPEFELAAKLAMENVLADPENADHRRAAAVAHYRLGQWREELGLEHAEPCFAKCLELRQAAVALDQTNDRKQLDLMIALARAGKTAESIGIANRYLALPNSDNEMRIDLARALAVCSGKQSPSEKSDSEGKAIGALDACVQNGFRDVVLLLNEIDFKPIRELPAFQAIVKRLAEIGPAGNSQLSGQAPS